MHYSIFQSPNIEDTRIITLSVNTYKCCVVYEVFEVKHFLDISKCLFRFLYMHMEGRIKHIIIYCIQLTKLFLSICSHYVHIQGVFKCRGISNVPGPSLWYWRSFPIRNDRLILNKAPTNQWRVEMGSSLLEKRKGLLRSKYVCYIKNKSVTVVK